MVIESMDIKKHRFHGLSPARPRVWIDLSSAASKRAGLAMHTPGRKVLKGAVKVLGWFAWLPIEKIVKGPENEKWLRDNDFQSRIKIHEVTWISCDQSSALNGESSYEDIGNRAFDCFPISFCLCHAECARYKSRRSIRAGRWMSRRKRKSSCLNLSPEKAGASSTYDIGAINKPS